MICFVENKNHKNIPLPPTSLISINSSTTFPPHFPTPFHFYPPPPPLFLSQPNKIFPLLFPHISPIIKTSYLLWGCGGGGERNNTSQNKNSLSTPTVVSLHSTFLFLKEIILFPSVPYFTSTPVFCSF